MLQSWDKQLRKSNILITWYIFLLASILLTAGLFFYNSHIENNIEEIWTEISQIDTSIAKLQENKSIQVYNLLIENKKVITNLEKKSKINDFIYHVRSLESYGLTFKWFNYNDWVITMQAMATFDPNSLASNRVSMFLKNYREDKKSMFNLDFVNSFNWFDAITFSVSLKLK